MERKNGILAILDGITEMVSQLKLRKGDWSSQHSMLRSLDISRNSGTYQISSMIFEASCSLYSPYFHELPDALYEVITERH